MCKTIRGLFCICTCCGISTSDTGTVWRIRYPPVVCFQKPSAGRQHATSGCQTRLPRWSCRRHSRPHRSR